MTRHEQIVTLARKGLDDKEIAEQVGCRREYVRVARRRERERAKGSESKSGTKYRQIIELFHGGFGDSAIADVVGCRREYVRVARRRAGLFRAPPRAGGDGASTAEVRLRRRIADLARKLAEAENALAHLERQKAEPSTHPDARGRAVAPVET